MAVLFLIVMVVDGHTATAVCSGVAIADQRRWCRCG